jgi:hypothetical protein
LRRSNFDLSTVLVAIGAVAVLVSLFLDWYGDPGQNAFTSFELTDWLLVALSVGALVVIGMESWSGGGAPNNRLAWICGILAFLVVAQLLDPPPAARGMDREIGGWLALGGSALMVVGAVLAMAEISVTIDVAERERRRRMSAVDARAEAEDASEAPTTAAPAAERPAGSGLWQAPSGSGSGSDRPAAPKAPTDVPERTQPFKPAEPPKDEAEADADTDAGADTDADAPESGDAKP